VIFSAARPDEAALEPSSVGRQPMWMVEKFVEQRSPRALVLKMAVPVRCRKQEIVYESNEGQLPAHDSSEIRRTCCDAATTRKTGHSRTLATRRCDHCSPEPQEDRSKIKPSTQHGKSPMCGNDWQ